MNSNEIYDAVLAKSLDHDVDINFLFPAVQCLGKNSNATDDDIFRAYFDSEIDRWRGGSPEQQKRAGDGVVGVFSKDKAYIKPIRYYLPVGTNVLNLHIDLYEKLLFTIADLKVRFVMEVMSTDINKIVKHLCADIIQTLHDRRVILN